MNVRCSRRHAALALAGLAGTFLGQLSGFAQDAAPTPTPAPVAGTIVSAPGVNARVCPGLDCEVAFSLDLGQSVQITGPAQDGWVPITRNGVSGWVWNLFVRAEGAPAPWLISGQPGCQRVAFLFNLGVGYETRMELLEWMVRERIPASIFPMGWWAEKYPDELRRMADLGFEIGSHGHDRNDLPTLGDGAVLADIAAAEQAIVAATGKPIAPLFTPFAAASDPRVRGLIASAGYLPVGWEVPADDWDFGVSPDDVFQNVVPNVVDGSIVEFHLDAPASAESTVVAVPWIVERLRNKGFTFVDVGDIALPCPIGLAASPAPAS